MSFALTVLLPLFMVNLVSFFVARGDKKRAIKGRPRVPERSFVILSFCFGGAGLLAAFHMFRHKTRHYGLLALVWAGTLLNLVMLYYGVWFLFEIGFVKLP